MAEPKNFEEYEQYFKEEHEEPFRIEEGDSFVMLSAPHAFAQLREGNEKAAEPQTGTLVRLLHDELDVPVIYRCSNNGDDPNYDEYNPYKDALMEYITENEVAYLIDLHLMKADDRPEIELGTGSGLNIDDEELLEIAENAFESRGFGPVMTDFRFSAGSKATVSSTVARNCGIQCLQIEINSALVYKLDKRYDFSGIYDALKEIIEKSEGLF